MSRLTGLLIHGGAEPKFTSPARALLFHLFITRLPNVRLALKAAARLSGGNDPAVNKGQPSPRA